MNFISTIESTFCISIFIMLTFQSWVNSQEDFVHEKYPNETSIQFSRRLFKNYDVDHRPTNSSDPLAPTNVLVDIYVSSVGHVSILNMHFHADIILRQRWNDPRLRFTGYEQHLIFAGKTDVIWTSDLFFRNAMVAKRHDVTKRNSMIRIEKNGAVLYSQKLSLVSSCTMNLQSFPMDTQVCYIDMGSYAYSMQDVVFLWKGDTDHKVNVQINEKIYMNEFKFPRLKTEYCTKGYVSTGQFTCIKVGFTFKRKFGFYLVYTYMPTIFIVGISWLSFFIDFTVTPARVTLSLLALLTLMTQTSSTINHLPRVSYIKALDIWLFTCLAFVVISLMEFAFVNSICKRQDDPPKPDDLKCETDSPEEVRLLSGRDRFRAVLKTKFSKETGHKIDRLFMALFPFCFLLFNIAYWVTYKK